MTPTIFQKARSTWAAVWPIVKSRRNGKKKYPILNLMGAFALASSVGLLAQGTIAPTPFQVVLDNSGAIVSGSCVWTYQAGTTTPATTYSDVGETTPNSNPIIADSAGRYTAFLTPGTSYKFVYETACTPPAHGSVLRTADNITAVPSNSGGVDVVGTAGQSLTAGQAVYLSDGSGSKTAGDWYPADNGNSYSSTNNPVGMVTAAIASGATGTIRMQGSVTGLSSLTIGLPYYVGTSGAITSTAPASNIQRLGVADTTSSLVLQAVPPTAGLTLDAGPSADASVTFDAGGTAKGKLWWDHTNSLLTLGSGTALHGLMLDTATGKASFGGAILSGSAYSFNAISGVTTIEATAPANNFAALFSNSAGAGQSFGLKVVAGTNASDQIFHLVNAASTADPFVVYGDGGIVVGPAIGTTKGLGTINVSSGIYLNGTAYTNPDWMLERAFTGRIEKFKHNLGAGSIPPMTLAQIEAFARQHYELPGVGQTKELFARADVLLANVERAYVALFDHEHRIDRLERAVKGLAALMALLVLVVTWQERRLRRIERR